MAGFFDDAGTFLPTKSEVLGGTLASVSTRHYDNTYYVICKATLGGTPYGIHMNQQINLRGARGLVTLRQPSHSISPDDG